MKTCRTGCNVNTLVIHTNVKHVDQVLDDLTECQCNDGKIIPAETKYRDTDDHTEQCCNCRTYKDRKDKARNLRDRICSHLRKQGAGKGSHAHKACMSKTQLTGKTNYQIQRNGCDGIDTKRNQKSHKQSGKISC